MANNFYRSLFINVQGCKGDTLVVLNTQRRVEMGRGSDSLATNSNKLTEKKKQGQMKKAAYVGEGCWCPSVDK